MTPPAPSPPPPSPPVSPAPDLVLYKHFLDTAEKVSDRRAAANTWMVSVNAAIVALLGYLGGEHPALTGPAAKLWIMVIPAAGALVCWAWIAMLQSYGKLNGAKFKVLQEMERTMPYAPFTREQFFYTVEGRTPLSKAERIIAYGFLALHGVLLLLMLWFRFGATP